MREFLLKASKARTAPFSLNDLPGAGRMDIVCRCVTAALWLSDDLRRDTLFHVILEGETDLPKLVTFDPRRMRRVYPNERNIASHIRNVLSGKTSEGISVKNVGFKEFLEEKDNLIYLHQSGEDIRKVKLSNDSCFILGDNVGLNKASEKLLDNLGVVKVSVGPKVYLSSACISVVQNEMDRRGI